MITCPSCKAENRDGAKRCRNCGTMLPQPVAQQPVGTPPYAPPQQQPGYPPPGYGPQPGYPPQPGYGQQQFAPAPPPAAKTNWLSKIRPTSVAIGCLLLLLGFLMGVGMLLGVQTITTASATATATPNPTATVVAATPPPAPSPQAKAPAPSKAPPVPLKDADGKDQDTGALIANKAAVIVFWTSGSKNDEAMAVLQKTASEKADKFAAIAINPNDKPSVVKTYAQDKGLNKITWLIDEGSARNAYTVTIMPVYFLIGKDGNIAERVENISKQDLENKINDLLK